jgi:hypothetical protein
MDMKELELIKNLANRWVRLAREHARDAKNYEATNERSAGFERGQAEAYNKAAQDLAAATKQLLKEQALVGNPINRENPELDSEGQTISNYEPGQERYAPVTINQAMQFLEYIGATAKDIKIHNDNAITAIFSRWQPLAPHERLEKIKAADGNIVILDQGRLQDGGGDVYVDFAFRAIKGE